MAFLRSSNPCAVHYRPSQKSPFLERPKLNPSQILQIGYVVGCTEGWCWLVFWVKYLMFSTLGRIVPTAMSSLWAWAWAWAWVCAGACARALVHALVCWCAGACTRVRVGTGAWA